jgi:chromosome segregation ATPase
MISSLSRELVREKSDKANIIEQIDKIRQENVTLRRQVKELSTSKLSLEKGLRNLENEKNNLADRISATEDILQTRMRELLEIKKDIESSLGTDFSAMSKQSESVELPPIVVKAGGAQQGPQGVQVSEKAVGKVLSINENQNFVIIDIGENNNVKIGDVFRIFRNNEHVATVEVIQTRKDISAADIKYSKDKIAAGDSVTSP